MLKKKEVKILENFAKSLISQKKSVPLVYPTKPKSGFWFGGGNMIWCDALKSFLLIGRFRDVGDSRFGTSKGKRGWKVSIFECRYDEKKGKMVLGKERISHLKTKGVLSYEGCSLYKEGKEYFAVLSSEKDVKYPKIVEDEQKERTGVWDIDLFKVNLKENNLEIVKNLVRCRNDPLCVHVKDPNVSDWPNNKKLMLFCHYSYSWSTGESGYAIIKNGSVEKIEFDKFSKGKTWDTAMVRVVSRIKVPKKGSFKDLDDISLYFYDSAECFHVHKTKKGSLPKGSSCEEISGVMYGFDKDFPKVHRISLLKPMFFSHVGTGCLRYASVLERNDTYFSVYQQSQMDYSQPLMIHVLKKKDVLTIFSKLE